MPRYSALFSSLCVVGVLTGCTTTAGDDPLVQRVYDTHRTVHDINNNLRESINQLNQNTAELSARLDASDRQTRLLRSKVEENQAKIEVVQQSLDDMTATLYRHFRLSPPPRLRNRPSSSDSARPTPSPSSEADDFSQDDVLVVPGDENGAASATEDDLGDLSEMDQAATAQRSPAQQDRTLPRATNPMDAYARCQELYRTGNYEEALRCFDEFLQRYSDTDLASNAQFWKASAYIKLEQFENAVRAFDTLRADYPNSVKLPTAMHNQAVAHVRLGQNARAEELFQLLIEQYPLDAAAERAKEKLRQLRQEQ